jgi:hypothetical protein
VNNTVIVSPLHRHCFTFTPSLFHLYTVIVSPLEKTKTLETLVEQGFQAFTEEPYKSFTRVFTISFTTRKKLLKNTVNYSPLMTLNMPARLVRAPYTMLVSKRVFMPNLLRSVPRATHY